jgi:hydrogenase maturation protein HypF
VPGVAPARARLIRVRGVVQGVGFRPFVYRLASEQGLTGWVLNDDEGVRIHVEGPDDVLDAFVERLSAHAPPAARIQALETTPAPVGSFAAFEIRPSERRLQPTARIAPDLTICSACLAELFDPADRRFRYPYINCTDCGPRYSVMLALPYDRPATTMREWVLCPECAREYDDPRDRRFHAQPVACPACGPHYRLLDRAGTITGDEAAIAEAAARLRAGEILAVKGLGGYHLACDAAASRAVGALRERKYRKEKPFALMAKDLTVARRLAVLSPAAEALLTDLARPIVLAPARAELPAVAPDNPDLGIMLPYAPLHYLLFAAGAPEALVMTSANRSSEPIAYRDDEALERLSGIADAFLMGERPVARRLDDSVARAGGLGPVILRRSRGYAPGAVVRLPAAGPVLAVGADLKNAITVVVQGDAFVSQHIGDLEQLEAFRAFQETIRDLTSMYRIDWEELRIAYDLHPEYASTRHARTLRCRSARAIQHHRAHVASVLAERDALDRRVVGVAFDGTGYGDDGTIWGGEFFLGSVAGGFDRVAHLRGALLPGGDAAARFPVQAAAGFLVELEALPDLGAAPFGFPARYAEARALIEKRVRTFATTSAGRLFDAAAALLGFTRAVTFEGQAAIWLEHAARGSPSVDPYPAPFEGGELDFRPLLAALARDRARGRPIGEIARAFHRGLARGTAGAILALCEAGGVDTAVLSGGVFQNELLLAELREALGAAPVRLWTNRLVPPNDGGISLGQAALLLAGADYPANTP